jgi:hypothetical protein
VARKELSWRAAVVTSLIITSASVFTTFLPQWNIVSINDRTGDFAYGFIVYFGGQFFTILVALKGLTHLLAGRQQ